MTMCRWGTPRAAPERGAVGIDDVQIERVVGIGDASGIGRLTLDRCQDGGRAFLIQATRSREKPAAAGACVPLSIASAEPCGKAPCGVIRDQPGWRRLGPAFCAARSGRTSSAAAVAQTQRTRSTSRVRVVRARMSDIVPALLGPPEAIRAKSAAME